MSHHHLHKKKTLHGVIQKIKFTRGKPNKKTLQRVIGKKNCRGKTKYAYFAEGKCPFTQNFII
jgi:hypothetical protein